MNQSVNDEWMKDCTYAWMNEWMNAWMKWIKKWINECACVLCHRMPGKRLLLFDPFACKGSLQSRDEWHHPPQVWCNPIPSADARVILPWKIFICQHLLNSTSFSSRLPRPRDAEIHANFNKIKQKNYISVRSSLDCLVHVITFEIFVQYHEWTNQGKVGGGA